MFVEDGPQSMTDSVKVLGVALSAINMQFAKGAIAKLTETNSRSYVCLTGVHGVIEAEPTLEIVGTQPLSLDNDIDETLRWLIKYAVEG